MALSSPFKPFLIDQTLLSIMFYADFICFFRKQKPLFLRRKTRLVVPQKIKRRFTKIKRRFARTKRRFILPKRRFIFALQKYVEKKARQDDKKCCCAKKYA